MIVNIDFLISPAYLVPAIRTMPLENDIATNTSEFTPSFFASASIVGACKMVNSGVCAERSARSDRMNMLCMNAECHALSLTSRTGMEY